jgi:hypothetical protein
VSETARFASATNGTVETMKTRTTIPQDVVAEVLTSSRRRCCVCFALRSDDGEKRGQIAHLDHDRSNSTKENLAFLCLEHHDQYDSRTSQSKGMTLVEVKRYRTLLQERLKSPFTASYSVPQDSLLLTPARIHLVRSKTEALDYAPRTAQVRFTVTNLREDLLKLVSLRVKILSRTERRRFRLPGPGAPHSEYALSADISTKDVVELLETVEHQFILKPGESDAFSLTLFGNEGYEYKAVLVAALESIASEEQWIAESEVLTVVYPIRTVEGSRGHGNLSH